MLVKLTYSNLRLHCALENIVFNFCFGNCKDFFHFPPLLWLFIYIDACSMYIVRVFIFIFISIENLTFLSHTFFLFRYLCEILRLKPNQLPYFYPKLKVLFLFRCGTVLYAKYVGSWTQIKSDLYYSIHCNVQHGDLQFGFMNLPS